MTVAPTKQTIILKHIESRFAGDLSVDYMINEQDKIVEAQMKRFDSSLLLSFAYVLQQRGISIAFDDGCVSERPDYKLMIRFAGARFSAKIVHLLPTGGRRDSTISLEVTDRQMELSL